MKGRDSKTRVNGTGAIVCRSYCTANNGHEELELFLLLLVLPRRDFLLILLLISLLTLPPSRVLPARFGRLCCLTN